ncbi:hypothetical protein [Fictibacillus gelatini]|uniref:hypothetical protein n=1 Tax=Fictibacillus gelatini TaxID=225985 RepID=UPI00041E1223|nr:hypothetical protein [Fictibacillus gelatini]
MIRLARRFNLTIILTISCLILLLGLVSYLYVGVYRPLHHQLNEAKAEAADKEKELQRLENSKHKKKKVAPIHIALLQQEVPVKPLVDQFLLQLKRAETVSGCSIATMKFGDGEAEQVQPDRNTAENNQPAADQNNKPQSITVNGVNEAVTTNGTEQKKTKLEGMPEELKQVNVSLEVKVPDYNAWKKFLSEIESSKRITYITAMKFAGPQESTGTSTATEPLTYSVELSAFYLPKLTELVKELPESHYELPSGKENPLFTTPKAANQ